MIETWSVTRSILKATRHPLLGRRSRIVWLGEVLSEMTGNNQAPPKSKETHESSQHVSESKEFRSSVYTRIMMYWNFSKKTAHSSELVNQLYANYTAG